MYKVVGQANLRVKETQASFNILLKLDSLFCLQTDENSFNC